MENPAFPFHKLPGDVIVEILARLPVKLLLKFKCVSKSWRALISSRRFVTLHLQNSKSDPNLTNHRVLIGNGGKFKQFSANSALYEPVSEAFDLGSPFQPSSGSQVIVGSCNGLLCLSADFFFQNNGDEYTRRDLILWNPSTRIRRDLASFLEEPYNRRSPGMNGYGFGYDKSSDDYKVVRFFHANVDSPEPEVMLQVYRSRRGEWETVKNNCVEHDWKMDHPAAFVNGKLHWIVFQCGKYPTRHFYHVCFDLETEECEILQMPDCINDRVTWLGECRGLLTAISVNRSCSDVWIKDCRGGVIGNWAKVATVPYINDYCWWTSELVLYSMNSPVLFLSNGSIEIFDAKDRSFRHPKIRNSSYFRLRGGYVESLVSPLG